MELENKIKCVLMDFEINKITLQQSTKKLLVLLDVVKHSEQLACPHQATRTPNEEKTGKCRQCGRNIKAN